MYFNFCMSIIRLYQDFILIVSVTSFILCVFSFLASVICKNYITCCQHISYTKTSCLTQYSQTEQTSIVNTFTHDHLIMPCLYETDLLLTFSCPCCFLIIVYCMVKQVFCKLFFDTVKRLVIMSPAFHYKITLSNPHIHPTIALITCNLHDCDSLTDSCIRRSHTLVSLHKFNNKTFLKRYKYYLLHIYITPQDLFSLLYLYNG